MGLTADYLLQVAVDLERQGKTFYETLALGCGHKEIAALAVSLAKAEEQHAETFKRMREALPEDQRGRFLDEAELWRVTEEVRHKMMPDAMTIRDIVLNPDFLKTLDMAIEMERDSVLFYSELGHRLAGSDAVTLMTIAAEEQDHLDKLERVRDLLSNAQSSYEFRQ